MENSAVFVTDEARKMLLNAWQKRKQEEIMHPYLEEKVMVGLLPNTPALLLARYLHGDLDAYPAFVMEKKMRQNDGFDNLRRAEAVAENRKEMC